MPLDIHKVHICKKRVLLCGINLTLKYNFTVLITFELSQKLQHNCCNNALLGLSYGSLTFIDPKQKTGLHSEQ